MSISRQPGFISVEDYLEGEVRSDVKHEYLGGVAYAMSGASNRHNRIASNVVGALWARLRGTSCLPYNSDTKIRIRLPSHVRFYYPDASVICRPNPDLDTYQDEPVVVVEVLSPSTRRVDLGEKLDAYLTIPSLAACLLVEQEWPAITVHRRTDAGFKREVHEGPEAVVRLPELGIELPLSEVYEGVTAGPDRTPAAGS